MEGTAQWEIAFLIGVPIAVFLAWFNKSDSDVKEDFDKEEKEEKKPKWKTDYYAKLEDEEEEENGFNSSNIWTFTKEIFKNRWVTSLAASLISGGIVLIIIGSFLEGSSIWSVIDSFIDSIQSFFGWVLAIIGFIVFFVAIALFSSLFGETTYTGPRGGKYRINSKGHKSYDVE